MIRNVLLLCFVFLSVAYHSLAQPARSRQKTFSAYQNNYQRVAGGLHHSLYIRNGTLWACGQNTDGRLGVNNVLPQNSFIQVGTDNDWVSVSGGHNHTLGLKSDGTLWAWGANGKGQLGLGAAAGTGNQLTPQRVGTDNKWISISAGAAHSMGLKSDGTLWVWGDNSSGQLGVGATPATSNVPVQVGTLTTWIAISAGMNSSFALRSDGSLWSWGYNIYGELGVGDKVNKNVPTRIGTDNDWISIAGGRYNGSALKSDGSLYAWGYAGYGPLGYVSAVDRTTPVRIGTDNDWVHMSLGDHFVATKSNGALWVWGWNFHGQLGNGSATANMPTPAQFSAARTWAYGVAAGFHTIAVERDGSVWVCGYNEFGQLGIGNNTNQYERNLVRITSPAPPVDWLGMSLGSDHTVGVKTDGTLWSWGKNDVGQLGVGDHISRNNAVQIGTDEHWISVSSAYNSALAFRMDGTLWGWGDNSSGQLGIGNTISMDTPVQVGTERKWRRVVIGEAHALGIKADGTLWSWGSNAQGQTGLGAAANIPQQVGSDNKWMNVSAGRLHSLGLKADGTLWVWGANDDGQLGTGSTTQQNAPLQIGTDKNWAIVSAGADHSLALKTDGTLWSWGDNTNGQLGIGNTTQQTSPQQIGVDRDWIGIFAGAGYSLALKSDGTLWGWGSNADGALGMGVIVNTTSPAQVSAQNDVVAIAGSTGTHSGILKVNRDFICMTGGNGDGQLGDGTLVNKAEFVCNVSLVPCTLPPIVVTKSGADTFCVGDSIVLSVPDGYSYQWKHGTTDVGNDSFYVAKQSGEYSVVVSNGGCADTSPVITVVVNPLPPDAATPSGPVSVCQSQNGAIYTVSAVSDATTYEWTYTGSGVTFVDGASTATPTNTVNFSGSATSGEIRVAAKNGCGASAVSGLAVTVGSAPVQPSAYTTSSTSVCLSQNGVTYTVPSVSDAATYEWTYTGTGATFVGGASTSIPTNTVNFSGSATSGEIRVAAKNSCGTSGVRGVAVTVGATPAQPSAYTTSSASVCQSQNGVTYTVPSVSGAATYEWTYTGTGATFVGGASTGTPTNTVNFSGSATSGEIRVAAKNSCGTSGVRGVAVAVGVAPAQPSAYTTSSTSVCQSQNGVTYTVPSVSGATTYEWTYTGTGATFVGGASTSTPTNTVNFSGSATSGEIRVAAKNSCGTSGVRGVAVTVGVAPAQPSAYTTSSTSVCQSQNSVTYTVPAVSGATTYEWTYTGIGATFVGGASTSTPTNTVNFSGSATSGEVRVAAKNTCGTSTVRSVAVTVNIPPVATVSAGGPMDICAGDSVTLTAGMGTGYSYQWKHNGAPAGTGGNTYAARATGDYKVVVTGPGGCGDSTLEVSVMVYDRPVATLDQNDTSFCIGGVVTLEVSTQDTGLTYTWKQDGVANPLATASFLEISESGSYRVIVGRTTAASCEDSTNEVTVTVHDLPVVNTTWDHELFHATPGYASYQWNTGSQAIPGETDSTFRPTSEGGYSVTVTDSNGCENTSPVYNVRVGIADAAVVLPQVQVYPNPSDGRVHIVAPVSVGVLLHAMDGRLLQRHEEATVIDISGYAAGVYLLQIMDGNGMVIRTERIVRQDIR